MANLFPQTLNWENPTSTEVNINQASFGVGGVLERSFQNINPLRNTRVVDIITKKYTVIENFLIANKGKTIRVPKLDNPTVDDGKLYRYSDWSIRYISPEVRGISFELKQVRRFKG